MTTNPAITSIIPETHQSGQAEHRTENGLRRQVELEKQTKILQFKVHNRRIVVEVLFDCQKHSIVVLEFAVEEHLRLFVQFGDQAVFDHELQALVDIVAQIAWQALANADRSKNLEERSLIEEGVSSGRHMQ